MILDWWLKVEEANQLWLSNENSPLAETLIDFHSLNLPDPKPSVPNNEAHNLSVF